MDTMDLTALLAIIKETRSVGESLEKLGASCCSVRSVKRCSSVENRVALPKESELEVEVLYGPPLPLLSVYAREMRPRVHRNLRV